MAVASVVFSALAGAADCFFGRAAGLSAALLRADSVLLLFSSVPADFFRLSGLVSVSGTGKAKPSPVKVTFLVRIREASSAGYSFLSFFFLFAK